MTFSVIMTLRSRQYISDFADLTKPTTRAIIADLTDIFTPFFNKTFQDFLQVIFTRFSPGSLLTNFDIYFEPTANVTNTSIIQALERGNGTKDLTFEILDKITFASGNPEKVETLETTEEGLKSVSSCLKGSTQDGIVLETYTLKPPLSFEQLHNFYPTFFGQSRASEACGQVRHVSGSSSIISMLENLKLSLFCFDA